MKSMNTTTGSTFYCHSCADKQGLLEGLNLTSTSPSTSQIDKAEKHTNPKSIIKDYNSVLNSQSTAEYDFFSKKALDEGFVEVEKSGGISLVYQSTRIIGTGCISGAPTHQQDSFRWVQSSDSFRAHGYSVESGKYNGAKCSVCGCNVMMRTPFNGHGQ